MPDVHAEEMMQLTKKDVAWVAHLARLDLDEADLEKVTKQLAGIVAYVDKLNELDTTDVEPLSHPGALTNVFREDEPGESLPVDDALRNAPEQIKGFFRVPRIIE